jgi:hypothetical protein
VRKLEGSPFELSLAKNEDFFTAWYLREDLGPQKREGNSEYTQDDSHFYKK